MFQSRFCSNLTLPTSVQKAATHVANQAMKLDLVPGWEIYDISFFNLAFCKCLVRVFFCAASKQAVCLIVKFLLFIFRRSPISVAAAAIYMASQASSDKRSQKGKLSLH